MIVKEQQVRGKYLFFEPHFDAEKQALINLSRQDRDKHEEPLHSEETLRQEVFFFVQEQRNARGGSSSSSASSSASGSQQRPELV
eukprot:COSAG06_NODE_29482_length_555_cov_1.649123_1_plen_84_part_10